MDRIEKEVKLLQKLYPNLQFNNDLPYWIVIPDFKLPKDRYNKETTNIHFILPTGYPLKGPDNFFVEQDLKLLNNSMPKGLNHGNIANNGEAKASGKWSWFSWHPNGWLAKADINKSDNLVTFVNSIKKCLKGVQES